MKAFATALIATAAYAGTTAEWKQRSVYQVLTDRFYKAGGGSACTNLSAYCGGTFTGLTDQLNYIQNMGFDAIWISPVITNYENASTNMWGYHGYWALNWETINAHFGTAQELQALVDAAHAKGIWVMVDVVANHSGPIGTDYSQIYPLDQSYHYHDDC